MNLSPCRGASRKLVLFAGPRSRFAKLSSTVQPSVEKGTIDADHRIHRCFLAVPCSLRDNPIVSASADHASRRQLCALSELGALVRCRSSRFDNRQLCRGKAAPDKPFQPGSLRRHCFQLIFALRLQVPARSLGASAFLFGATIRASRLAPWHLVLDLSGDELPLRPLPTGGDGSDIFRVRPVHGLLSRDDFRPSLPYVRDASAVSFRKRTTC